MNNMCENNMEKENTSPALILGARNIQLEKTKDLQRSLIPYGLAEGRTEMKQRISALGGLHQVWITWVAEESLRKGLPANVAHSVGGNVFPHGSYRLGVHFQGADIDALCVAPRHIERSDFFGSFYNQMKKNPWVDDLRMVPNKLIKMTYNRIRFSLSFAKLDLAEIPETFDLREAPLEGLDKKCLRSLSGCIISDEILRLVPNINHFRITFRTIKLWAKSKRIYSKQYGYLGFESLAMLVAYTCHVYPDALPATLVHAFFDILNQWKWPQPVLLSRHKSNNLRLSVQDPTVGDFMDFFDRMPISTPLPMFNLSDSTRAIVIEEITRGLAVTKDVWRSKCGWERLFEEPNFYSKYNEFIVVMASSTRTHHQQIWKELLESQLPHFVDILDGSPFISIAHLNSECYNSADINTNCSMWVIGMVFETELQVDLSCDAHTFINSVYSQAENTHIYEQGMDIEMQLVQRDELVNFLPSSLLSREDTCQQATPKKTKKRASDYDNNPSKRRKCFPRVIVVMNEEII